MASPSRHSWLLTLLPTDSTLLLVGLVCVPAALYFCKPRKARAASDDSSTDFSVFLKVQPPVQPAPRPRAEKKQATSFRAFLKDDVADTQDSCDFDTFLRSSASNAAAAKPAVQNVPAEAPKGPSSDEIKVPVFYGTEYGFSKEIAEKLCSMLEAAGQFWCVALQPACTSSGRLLTMQRLQASTDQHGRPPGGLSPSS